MNFLYPRIPRDRVPVLFELGARGALIAGLYGILHDQITYTISAEYFTLIKFRQFAWANLGWSPRAFAGEIGFLASWWVGMLAGWVIGRVTIAAEPREMRRLAMQSFALIFGSALLFAAGAYVFGLSRNPTPENSELAEIGELIGATDVPAFVRVAYIHNASYLGGLAGLIGAAMRARRKVRPKTAP